MKGGPALSSSPIWLRFGQVVRNGRVHLNRRMGGYVLVRERMKFVPTGLLLTDIVGQIADEFK